MEAGGDGVYRFLVRYGTPGFVGRFGSVHAIAAPRGAWVAVATDRGVEAGQVLVSADDPKLKHDSRPPVGEILRALTDDDQERRQSLQLLAGKLLEQGRELAASQSVGVALLDGEVLLGGDRAVLYYAGESTTALGPIAVALSRCFDGLHVQFQPLGTALGNGEPQVSPSSEEPRNETRPPPQTYQERVKSESSLRWPEIVRQMDDPHLAKLKRDDAFLLQWHGVYQQQLHKSRHVAFMARIKPPGGRLTARQLLTLLDLADEVGDGTLRITARQGLQLHGVAKQNVRRTIQKVEGALLTTLGACGDGSRNVMCCPAPQRNDRIRTRIQSLAAEIARLLAPQGSAYYDLWIADSQHNDPQDFREPLYGPTYLPRKLKVGIALPEDNCVDVLAQDVGLMAVTDDERLRGFNVLVGGGLAASTKRPDATPHLAEPLAFVSATDALRIVDAIVQVHRDFGNRQDRRRGRLRHLIQQVGLDEFRRLVELRFDSSLEPPVPLKITGCDDHLGWRRQGDGNLYLGLRVLSGRIGDLSGVQLKTFLRQVLAVRDSAVRLTPQQNLLLCDLEPQSQQTIEHILSECGVPFAESMSLLRRHAMACPALPTCGLAVAEAERLLPQLLAPLQAELERRGLQQEPFSLRLAGCSNGCSRSALADIALVGRSQGTYAIYAGGRLQGDRLNVLVREHVPENRLVQVLASLFDEYLNQHLPEESFSDCLFRLYSGDPGPVANNAESDRTGP
jgi:sulfite reductase (ferredoxin)